MNFIFLDQSEEERYLREIQLIDNQTFEVFYDKLTFIYLEMPKFRKEEDALETHFDKWMYVLKNLHQLQDRPAKLKEKIFEKLFNEAEIAKLTPEDMKAYEESLKIYRDNKASMDYAISEALKERDIEIAKEMKKDNQPIELIVKYTGLSKEQIEKL